MSYDGAPQPRPWDATPAFRAALILTTGLAVGAMTSIGQAHLSGTLNPLVNSASAWLVAPFFIGSRMRSDRGAAAAGLAVCLLQLVGYSVTAELRGFSAGGSILVFWSACALVGGPIFGAAGRAWRARTDALRDLGAAVLPAAFLAEGLWVYVYELHYYSAAALWIAIGAVLALTLTRGLGERRWLALTVAGGLAGEALLTQIYSQTF
jgi:hypothetical protein